MSVNLKKKKLKLLHNHCHSFTTWFLNFTPPSFQGATYCSIPHLPVSYTAWQMVLKRWFLRGFYLFLQALQTWFLHTWCHLSLTNRKPKPEFYRSPTSYQQNRHCTAYPPCPICERINLSSHGRCNIGSGEFNGQILNQGHSQSPGRKFEEFLHTPLIRMHAYNSDQDATDAKGWK